MRNSDSNLCGAIAARPSLAPFAFTRKPLSMPDTLASASTPTHCVANLFLFLIWTIESMRRLHKTRTEMNAASR
jgi:hypothetical protein